MDFIRLQVIAMIPAGTRRPLSFEGQINLRANLCQNSGEGSDSETGLYGSSLILSCHYHSKNSL